MRARHAELVGILNNTTLKLLNIYRVWAKLALGKAWVSQAAGTAYGVCLGGNVKYVYSAAAVIV